MGFSEDLIEDSMAFHEVLILMRFRRIHVGIYFAKLAHSSLGFHVGLWWIQLWDSLGYYS
jgi:hypothetical protein